jgi:hypothetical protein
MPGRRAERKMSAMRDLFMSPKTSCSPGPPSSRPDRCW